MKKAILVIAALVVTLRLASYAGASEALADWVREITTDGSFISATLSLELGGASGEEEASGSAVISDDPPAQEHKPQEYIETLLVDELKNAEDNDTYEGEPGVQAEIVPITITSDLSIKNDTGYEIDIEALAQEGLDLALNADEPHILIIHTHSSESYAQDPDDPYEESDPNRTEDTEHNIVKVGDVLTEIFEEYGLNVIHDSSIYDYPSYTGSYSRSGEAVEAYLAQYPSIRIVIDIHRDAIGSGDNVYKTEAEIPGDSCAQVMLLVGTGEKGLYHPNWKENLKLALYMQSAMDKKYPTLARPIALVQERYNQHLTNGSLILEVGSTGNTLKEALNAIELFGKAVGPALAELIVQ